MYQILICDDELNILEKIQEKVKTQFNKEKINADYLVISDSRQIGRASCRERV